MGTWLRNVDASWLRMDDPTNLMVVSGVLVLDAPVPVERLRALLEERIARFRRFTSRVAVPAGGVGLPSWEPDPAFSVDRHLHVRHLDAGDGEPELQALVSDLLSRPLPADRPLWSAHLVPRFQGGSAVVFRVHHCIGDGLALVHVLLSLADEAPLPARRRHAPRAAWGITLGRRALAGAGALLDRPGRLADLARMASSSVASLASLLALPSDPRSAFKGPLGRAKRVGWSRALDLDDFKAAARATGSTVNDVLMAALAGALRRYLAGRGEVPGSLEVRGVVPVNLRPPEEAGRLGNRFGLVFLALPLGIEDPLDRLFEVRRRMRALKESTQALAVYQVLWAMGVAPRPVFDLALGLFASKGTAVVTNVVGPRNRISIAGAPLRQAMFWVPSAGRLGLGVSLLSYAGKVWMGLQCDAGLVPDPEKVLVGFEEELAALLELRRAADS